MMMKITIPAYLVPTVATPDKPCYWIWQRGCTLPDANYPAS